MVSQPGQPQTYVIPDILLQSLATSLNLGGNRRTSTPHADLLQGLATKRARLHTQEVGGLAGPGSIPGGVPALTKDVKHLPDFSGQSE